MPYLEVLQKYAVFSGRASRSEFWLFSLVHAVILGVLATISLQAQWFIYVYGLYALALIIPVLAVTVRRLHDTGRSGWWWFIGAIPVIGWIILIVFLVGSSDHDNIYGPRPGSVADSAGG